MSIRKQIREFYFDYGPISIFAVLLTACVCVSYVLSRDIPVELFERVISPILHGAIFLTAIVGAIITHRHIDGLHARRMWMQALIAWAAIEGMMMIIEKYLGVHTIIIGVQTIDTGDFIIRDVLAVILLAYPVEVLRPKWLNWWRGVLLVLPAILISVLDTVLHEDLRALMIVYPLLIAGVLWSQIREYRAKMEENYSSLENSALPWLRIYLTIMFIMGLSYFYISFTYHPTRLFTQQWLVLVLLVYNTAQIALRRKPWVEAPMEEPVGEAEEDAIRRQCREKLEAWMANEKPYLNPEFRLVDLMRILPMNRTYLSQFINVEYGCNFYQYVTNYRIEESKRLMRENPEWKLQEIAEKSGFSSATMFSRVFMREIGQTPTEWQSAIDNK